MQEAEIKAKVWDSVQRARNTMTLLGSAASLHILLMAA